MLENILLWFVLVSGLYLIFLGLLMSAKGFASVFIFKFIPVILGFGCVLYFLIARGLLSA